MRFFKFINLFIKIFKNKYLLIFVIISITFLLIFYKVHTQNDQLNVNSYLFPIYKSTYGNTSLSQKNTAIETWKIQNNRILKNYNTNDVWKIVLYLDPWYGEWGSSGRLNLTESKCPEQRCVFTDDPKALSNADVVLFAFNRMPSAHDKKGHLEQKWMCAEVEPPPLPHALVLPDACDWWLSYSQHSDIPAGYYGYFLPINYTVRPLFANILSESSSSYVDLQAALSSEASLASVTNERLVSHFTNKSKIVAWMSSRCPVQSNRKSLVNELQKYIQVDTYGKCGTQKCFKRDPLGPMCWQQTLSKYSFYLAMENTLCDEYITEKVYMPMLHGLVPVVYGGANYSRYLPPHSYIDASTFGVEALAKLLTYLHNNPRKLEKYHLWRGFYKVQLNPNICDLCAVFHDTAWLSQRRPPKNELTEKAKSKCREPPLTFKNPW